MIVHGIEINLIHYFKDKLYYVVFPTFNLPIPHFSDTQIVSNTENTH